ncbi:MAG TPA: serine/threonine-protein kinase [Lacipirellulaceae bacterium]|nr:serine/threonine-protein kinase [Lacipirellulaceae bacterium]
MSVGIKEFVGPYRMFHLIRAGALFEIWAVRPVAETTAYAMKWLPPGSRYDRASVANLKHEYDVGRTLNHPSIIKTHDFGTGKDGAYLVMELFKTPNIKQQLVENIAMLHWRLEKILIECATALDYMHEQGWVHRDIKPDNFLVDDENHVRLIDFNLTRKVKSGLSKLISNKMPVQGTYSYMAPEQIRGVAVDQRADIYSLGCMCYEMITGKLPFTATSPAELLNKHLKVKPQHISVLNKNVHADFADLVTRMLAKEPKERPASLKDFIRTLKAGRIFQIKPRKPLPKDETKRDEE